MHLGEFSEDACLFVEGSRLAHFFVILLTDSAIHSAFKSFSCLGNKVNDSTDWLNYSAY